jgi:hypothetical protein
MTKYSIQIRNPNTKLWVTQQTISPLYTYSTMRFRRWLFFRKVFGVIANLAEAEKNAKKLAVRTAKKLYSHLPCQVERISMWNGIKEESIVWQNRKSVKSAVTK